MSKLLEYLPPYAQNSRTFQQTTSSIDEEFKLFNSSSDDVEMQFSLDTATWGLSIYEKELGIKTDLNKSYEDRRSVVKSKWRGKGKVDAKLIKIVADAWTNGDVEVTFDGKINIKFNSIYGIPSNLDDLKNALEDIKPAHLRILYQFAYLLIKDINESKTLVEMEQIPLNQFAGGEA